MSEGPQPDLTPPASMNRARFGAPSRARDKLLPFLLRSLGGLGLLTVLLLLALLVLRVLRPQVP